MTVYPVIMAGGQGTRFWPQSRQDLPKQFLPLMGEETLLQTTFRRLATIAPAEHCFVLTDQRYGALVAQQLPQLPPEHILLEPANRDTAPCIGLATAKLYKQDPSALLAVFPADHHIPQQQQFQQAVATAIRQAQAAPEIVTIGIRPTYPAQGYGYIKVQPQGEGCGCPVYEVSRFVEKPCLAKAQEYLACGDYFWNSGMFFFQAAVMQESLARLMPVLYQGLEGLYPALNTPAEAKALAELYPGLTKISLDYGIMEKADNVSMVVGEFGWDDVGTWQAAARYWQQDREQNHWCCGQKPVTLDTRGCLTYASHGLVATLGVENLLIVCCDDVVLVADKNRSQEVKQLVEEVRRRGLDTYL